MNDDVDDLVSSFRAAPDQRAPPPNWRTLVCNRCRATVLRGTALAVERVVKVTVDPHLVPCVRDVWIPLPPDPRFPGVSWERIAWFVTAYRRFDVVTVVHAFRVDRTPGDVHAVVLQAHESRHLDEPGRFVGRRLHVCGGER